MAGPRSRSFTRRRGRITNSSCKRCSANLAYTCLSQGNELTRVYRKPVVATSSCQCDRNRPACLRSRGELLPGRPRSAAYSIGDASKPHSANRRSKALGSNGPHDPPANDQEMSTSMRPSPAPCSKFRALAQCLPILTRQREFSAPETQTAEELTAVSAAPRPL